MCLVRRFASVLAFALMLGCSALAGAQAYTSVVVFGDSLSDTGNFAHLSTSAYGLQIPGPLADYTAGRFTDGTDTIPAAQVYQGVWIEQLASTFTAKPAVKDSLDGGTDYAYGSATNAGGTQVVTYGPGNALSVTVNNIGAQIAAYLATKPTITANTLFVVWGGANDLLQATTTAQITAAAQLEIANVQALIAAGATSIIVPNLPPLGAIPRLNTTGAAALQATAAAAAYNQGVASGVAALKAASPSVHLYMLDVYSLFNTILAAPQSVFGFANVTNSSQALPTVNPDTYLFWDDLHPTTAGHHLVAKAAGNLLTETTASTTTLTVGTGNAIPGQTVSLKAVVAAVGGSTPTPTGTVTFYNGSAPLVTATVDSSGTANASLAAPAVGTYAISAYYSADAVYTTSTSSAATLNVLATPVATSTTLTSTGSALNQGASVTFTATVTSLVGPPSGSVKFMDGTSLLGTVTLAGSTSSVASLTLTTLGAGSHSITAVYVPTTNFAASTSSAVAETVTAPAFTFTANPTSLTVQSGADVTSTLTFTSVGGLTGTYTLGCGTLPAHGSCYFPTPTFVATGTNTTLTGYVTIGTNANNTTAALQHPVEVSRWSPVSLAAFAFLPCLGGMALLRRRRRELRSLWTLAIILSAGIAGLGMSGCGSTAGSYFTPAGTYQVPVTLSASGSVVSTVNITLVVQ